MDTLAIVLAPSSSLVAQSERYRQRCMVNSRLFRRGINLLGDGDVCRRRIVNCVNFRPSSDSQQALDKYGRNSLFPTGYTFSSSCRKHHRKLHLCVSVSMC